MEFYLKNKSLTKAFELSQKALMVDAINYIQENIGEAKKEDLQREVFTNPRLCFYFNGEMALNFEKKEDSYIVRCKGNLLNSDEIFELADTLEKRMKMYSAQKYVEEIVDLVLNHGHTIASAWHSVEERYYENEDYGPEKCTEHIFLSLEERFFNEDNFN